MKTRLTDAEQNLLNEAIALNEQINKLTNEMHDKMDALVNPFLNSDDFDSRDLEFWIGVLPSGFHRSELKVLQDLLSTKKKK
jgi:hypothetical protein